MFSALSTAWGDRVIPKHRATGSPEHHWVWLRNQKFKSGRGLRGMRSSCLQVLGRSLDWIPECQSSDWWEDLGRGLEVRGPEPRGPMSRNTGLTDTQTLLSGAVPLKADQELSPEWIDT